MATYSLYVLPATAFTTSPGGYQPFQDGYIAPDGSNWQYATGTFTYARDAATLVTIDDTDGQDTVLNDYGVGESTQQLAEAVGGYPAGTTVENEFEITVVATVDGVEREYRLVALSANGASGTIAGYTFDGPWPPEGTLLTARWSGTQDSDGQSLDSGNMLAPCFTRGVRIMTDAGERAIEDLRAGDLVLTRDRGLQPIRWIGSARLTAAALARNPAMRPVRIRAHALGRGLPATDLVVSPQHRILVRSKVARTMFGADEVLVAAKQLLQIDGIDLAEDLHEVEYFHMLFDRHEVVVSNGAETESLYPGPEALRSVGRAALDEILALFPELRALTQAPVSARLMPSGRQSRKLAVRHLQHGRPLVS